MAIVFQCRCGKHLKARENNAGRRTICPNCGAPVGIPTRRPTHRGAEHLSTAIIPTARNISATPAAQRNQRTTAKSPTSSGGALRNMFPRRSRSSRRCRSRAQGPEIRLRHQPRWMKLCSPTRPISSQAADPIIAGVFLIGVISAAIAVSGGFTIQLLPRALQDGWLALPHSPLIAVAATIFALAMTYAASFVGQTMVESVEGRLSEWQFDVELERAAKFAVCGLASLLSGPVLFLAGGVLYWMNCGRMTPLDGIILAELALAGVASWLALCCGSAAIGQLALTSPAKFRDAMRCLGYRGLAGMLAASILITLHLTAALFLCRLIQNDEQGAMLALAGCAFSGMIVTTLLLSQLSRMSARNLPQFA
jgi:hypothetical protein